MQNNKRNLNKSLKNLFKIYVSKSSQMKNLEIANFGSKHVKARENQKD